MRSQLLAWAERIAVSETGETWSPIIAPESTHPSVPMKIGLPASSVGEVAPTVAAASGTTIGTRIPIVPYAVPVQNDTSDASRNTTVGIQRANVSGAPLLAAR